MSVFIYINKKAVNNINIIKTIETIKINLLFFLGIISDFSPLKLILVLVGKELNFGKKNEFEIYEAYYLYVD